MRPSPLARRWLDARHFVVDRTSPDFKRRISTLVDIAGGEPKVLHEVVEEKFWSTPARFGDSQTREVIEITLGSIRLINHITFNVAKFPHDVDLECFDEDRREWGPIFDANHDGDEPCRHSVLDCNPQVLPPASSIKGDRHPQHSFSEHWDSCEFLCKPVRFQRRARSGAKVSLVTSPAHTKSHSASSTSRSELPRAATNSSR